MNILKPKTKGRICFVHVPKCGGQSIKSGIGRAYNSMLKTAKMKAAPSLKGSTVSGPDNSKPGLHDYREYVLRYFLSDPELGLMMGHYPCRQETLEAFTSEWDFVTILRNPVDRFVSHYLYNNFKQSEHFKQDQSLDDFLETQRAAASAEMYVRYFSHYPNSGSLAEGIEQAKRNLAQFKLVGTLENLDDWQEQFHRMFNSRVKIGRTNTSPKGAKEAKQSISEAQIKKITQLCEPSMEIYEYAKSLLKP